MKKEMTEEALSTDTVFCQSLVATGMLTRKQMLNAAARYRLGRSGDGGVVFWEIDERKTVRDGKIMFYADDCHRIKDRNASWVSSRMTQHYGYPGQLPVERCLFGLHLLEPGRTVAVVEAEKTAEAAQAEFKHPIRMSRILEDHATPEQKAAKIDIVDLIFGQ